MPYQNRVTPLGDLVASAARGTLMGNRGCLHDDTKRIVRSFAGKRWIICLTDFKGRRREIMPPGGYTQLFFLDEATALAAGHRPCAECRRDRFSAFRTSWAAANPALAGGPQPSADILDAALHHERIAGNRWSGRQRVTYTATLGELPDGVLVLAPDIPAPALVYQGALYPWSHEGYGSPQRLDARLPVKVLTPRSSVRALAHSYEAGVHESVKG